MANAKNNTAPGVVQTPSADRIEAMDTLNARHAQVQGILATMSMSFDSADAVPNDTMVKNAIWAARDLLKQASDAADLLYQAR